MKKMLMITMAAALMFSVGGCEKKDALIDSAHNSRNSLEWEGVYAGEIPGKDYPDLKVTVILRADSTYEAHYQYIHPDDEHMTATGTFTWDKDGGVITMDQGMTKRYRVGENRLILLDLNDRPVTGELADKYVLRKQP
ncbi:MAG: copper resistance protein NlpE [Verrucomicrobiales bacterium]|jgi:uncharacterized lipoprotein NlpE involved in copper resistance|nr:copper resistance protein NlpE [Verrucomicrobiales bacterium]